MTTIKLEEESYPLNLKLIRIMLVTWNLVRKYTHISRLPCFCLCQHFFAKYQHFLSKIVPSLKVMIWELRMKFFSYVFGFYKIKYHNQWKCKFCRPCFRNPASGFLQIDHKLKIVYMTSSSISFDIPVFLLSGLVTGPSFMSISSQVLEIWQFTFIRDWPEIRK